LRQDLERQELEELPFKPTIDKRSEQIVARRNDLRFSENVSDDRSSLTQNPGKKSKELY